MIDTKSEELLTLSQASRALPAVDGRRPHPSTIFRWIRDGVRGGVRLEHVRVGGRVCTSADALDRFMNAAAEAPAPPKMQPARPSECRTPKQREAAIAAAKERLAAAGLASE